jgi:hypothetical protein
MAFARKLVARYWAGQHAHMAAADPPGLRTVARFTLRDDRPDGGPDRGPIDDLLLVIAAELARDLVGPLEVTRDAIRACPEPGTDAVDVVRFGLRGRHAPAAHTLELTRAWTGVYLGAQTRRVLGRIDDALRAAGATELLWFARHDRAFAEAFQTPFDEQALTVRQ